MLDNVQPGRYWLKVDPFNGYVASAVAGSVDLLRQPLVVSPGGTSPSIDIVLRDDCAAIDGTVEGMPAKPSSCTSANQVRRPGRDDRICAGLLCSVARLSGPLRNHLGLFRRDSSTSSNLLRGCIAFSLSTASKMNLNIRMRKP